MSSQRYSPPATHPNPSSNPETVPEKSMAATQPPLISHKALPPPPSLFRSPFNRLSPLMSAQPYLPRPYPLEPAYTSPTESRRPLNAPRPNLSPSRATYAQTTRPAAAIPLEKLLLQPETYPSQDSTSLGSSRFRQPQHSAESAVYSEPSRSKVVPDPILQRLPGLDRSGTVGSHSLRGEYKYNGPPPWSPGYRSHRNSESSQYSSAHSTSDHGTRPGSATIPGVSGPSTNMPSSMASRHRLTVRQQPIAARACGFGERDRRVIDPPPIVQLTLDGFNPTSAEDVKELQWPLNVVHCALFSASGPSSNPSTSDDVTAISDPHDGKVSRRLMGTLVANAFVGVDPEAPNDDDPNARIGSFFVFPDLSCRQGGLYRLRFVLISLNVESLATGSETPRSAMVFSDVFEVFSAKDFPGMRSSTLLTRELKRQGANVAVKKGNDPKLGKKGKRTTSSRNDGSSSDGSGLEAVQSKKSQKT